MTEIENQQSNPDQPTLPVVLEKGGDAGTQSVASENTGETDFTGTQDPMSLAAHADHGDLESLNTVEAVEALVATPDEVKAFVERLLRLYAISYSWKHVEDTVRNRLMGELPMGFDVATLISMAVDAQASYSGISPDHDTRGQEEGAHGEEDSVEAEITQAEADEVARNAKALGEGGDTRTQSELSAKTGIPDEVLDEPLPCGHTRRDHHAEHVEAGGPMGLLAKLLGGAGPVEVKHLPGGFNLFEALNQRVSGQPEDSSDDEDEGTPLQRRLADNTPLIEAKLEVTLPSGEIWMSDIQVEAGHAWGHSLHGDEQCLKALASLVEQLLVEMHQKFDREMLLARLEYDSQPKNTCVK